MLGVLGAVFGHRLFLSVLSSWTIVQAIKVIIPLIKEKKLKWSRFVEPGGMPSSHAAAVIALLVGVGILEGCGSTIFILTLIFALVTIYEAIGVRKTVQEQAELLDMIIRKNPPKNFVRSKLKKSLGHTPLEVGVGIVIGFIISLIWMT